MENNYIYYMVLLELNKILYGKLLKKYLANIKHSKKGHYC